MFSLRLKGLVAFLLFSLMGCGSLYFSVEDISDYFNWNDLILYSWMTPFIACFSFIFFAVAIAPGHVIIFGRHMSIIYLRKLSKLMMIIFVSSILISLIFSLLYINSLNSRGYVRCKGIPSGWMPGMATKYTTNAELCLKKTNQ